MRKAFIYLICPCLPLFFFQYLTKQNLALREVNESRVKVYEQLEETLAEMEADAKRRNEEAKADKGKVKRSVANS